MDQSDTLYSTVLCGSLSLLSHSVICAHAEFHQLPLDAPRMIRVFELTSVAPSFLFIPECSAQQCSRPCAWCFSHHTLSAVVFGKAITSRRYCRCRSADVDRSYDRMTWCAQSTGISESVEQEAEFLLFLFVYYPEYCKHWPYINNMDDVLNHAPLCKLLMTISQVVQAPHFFK